MSAVKKIWRISRDKDLGRASADTRGYNPTCCAASKGGRRGVAAKGPAVEPRPTMGIRGPAARDCWGAPGRSAEATASSGARVRCAAPADDRENAKAEAHP